MVHVNKTKYVSKSRQRQTIVVVVVTVRHSIGIIEIVRIDKFGFSKYKLGIVMRQL
jgi:hypothetical protein